MEEAQSWEGNFTPFVKGPIMKHADTCRKFICFYVGKKEYEVNEMNYSWTVDLGMLCCDCREG